MGVNNSISTKKNCCEIDESINHPVLIQIGDSNKEINIKKIRRRSIFKYKPIASIEPLLEKFDNIGKGFNRRRLNSCIELG